MGIMHDEHTLILENAKQFSALRELLFLLWELEVVDNIAGNYLLDEADWMWAGSLRLNKVKRL
jgi:hypothetical protein